MARGPAGHASVLALLDGLPGEEWVYWCIDDRFPTRVDGDVLSAIVAGLDAADGADEVKLLHWKERLTGERATVGGTPFTVQATGSRHRGFWHHHFVRTATLRRVFGRDELSQSTTIADVLRPLSPERRGRRWERRRAVTEAGLFEARALVPHRAIVELGEPLRGGRLTSNGLAELRRRGCEVPPYPFLKRDLRYP